MEHTKPVIAYGKPGRTIAVRLKPGMGLLEGLQEACEEAGIKNGVIVSALGSLSHVRLCTAVNMPGSKTGVGYGDPMELPGPMELLAASGVICHDPSGEINLHIHAAFSDPDGHVMGGHLTTGTTVLITIDAVIQELDGVEMERIVDPELDLPILTPRTK